MEKFEITKEQVLTIYNATSVNNQDELKQWFPGAFKTELEIGKWAKSKSTNCLVFITEFTKYGFNGYGFDNENKFCNLKNDEWTSVLSLWRVATEQEAKTALINEAKKRGFIESATFNSLDGNTCSLLGDIFIYNRNVLYASSGMKDILFENGKWATIIETITKEDAEKLLNKKII